MVEIASSRGKRIQFHNFSTLPCGFGRKNLSEQTSSDRDSIKEEEKQNKLRYGTLNLEKRRHPRFNVGLPMEYSRTCSLNVVMLSMAAKRDGLG